MPLLHNLSMNPRRAGCFQPGGEGKCEGKCEGKKLALTLALTLETPINRALQTDCEGVRAKKEKKLFFILEVDE